MIIRLETAGDSAAIAGVIREAFGGRNESCAEADLVDRLRRDHDIVLSLVAEQDGQIMGHIAFSRLWIVRNSHRFAGVGLAPLAVLPAVQGKGIGRALVETGHARLRDMGETIVFVLGDPDYYSRFAFSLPAARAFDCRYAGEHFQVLRLSPSAPEAGAVSYAQAFNDMG